MSHLEPLFIIPWKRLLVAAGILMTILLTVLCLAWSDTRKGSGRIEFRPTTVGDELAMGRQFFRHRYIWLALAKGETVTFDYSIEPAGSLATIDVRQVVTFWRFNNAALCDADRRLVFVAPNAGLYRIHFLMIRGAFGGREPTVLLDWRTHRTANEGALPQEWSSGSFLQPSGREERIAKQLRRCEQP